MNLDFLPLFLAELFDLSGLMKAAIPIVGILVGGAITISIFYLQHRENKALHETARLALEKGQPIPPELLDQLNGKTELRAEVRREPTNDLRTGLILVAVGAGIYVFFAAMSVQSLRYLGAIPGFIGVALLLYGSVAMLATGKKPTTPDRSAQP